jgi:hypothetical protein
MLFLHEREVLTWEQDLLETAQEELHGELGAQ